MNFVDVQAEVREGYKKEDNLKVQTHWLEMLEAPKAIQQQHKVVPYTLLK